MKTFLAAILFIVALIGRAELVFSSINTSADVLMREDQAAIGYFTMMAEVSNLEDDDIYVFVGMETVPGFQWRVNSFRPGGFVGVVEPTVWTTADIIAEDGLFEIKAGASERFRFGFSVISHDDDDVNVEVIEMQITRSLNQDGPRIVETVRFEDFSTDFILLDGNPIVPEPGSFTLFALGLVALRKLVNKQR